MAKKSKALTKAELLNVVDDAYPDGKIREAMEADKASAECPEGGVLDIGDTLAVFLYYELVHDEAGCKDTNSQLAELIGRCDSAVSEIEGVKRALIAKQTEIQHGKN